MRVVLSFEATQRPVPYDHMPKLVGRFHGWMGEENDLHGAISLYSVGWLAGGRSVGDEGLRFEKGGRWPVSFADPELARRFVKSVRADPGMPLGLTLRSARLVPSPPGVSGPPSRPPTNGEGARPSGSAEKEGGEKGEEAAGAMRHTFWAHSPVLVRERRARREHYRHVDYTEPDLAARLLTRTMRAKMEAHGFSEETRAATELRFRPSPGAHTKRVDYRSMSYHASLCPVEVSGPPAALAFAWAVGAGSHTGMGMGCLLTSPAELHS